MLVVPYVYPMRSLECVPSVNRAPTHDVIRNYSLTQSLKLCPLEGLGRLFICGFALLAGNLRLPHSQLLSQTKHCGGT